MTQKDLDVVVKLFDLLRDPPKTVLDTETGAIVVGNFLTLGQEEDGHQMPYYYVDMSVRRSNYPHEPDDVDVARLFDDPALPSAISKLVAAWVRMQCVQILEDAYLGGETA